MPIYEYKCPKCGMVREIYYTTNKKMSCKCGVTMKKIMSVPAKPVIH